MHAVTERGFAFTSTTGLVRPEARCGVDPDGQNEIRHGH